MKCLNTILNSLLLSFMIVICIQFSCCLKTPDLLEDRPHIPTSYPRSSDHISYVDFDTSNLDYQSRNDYIANFDHYALKLTSKEILLKFRKLMRIDYKDIIIMRGLTVIFNAEEILQKDIFKPKDFDRQEKLNLITNIVKNRYSIRFEHCRFFFSIYPKDDDNYKPPRNLKKYQWIHLNSLCFDSLKAVHEFDQEFAYLYLDFLKKTQYESLKFYDLTDEIYFQVDYKALITRTTANKETIDQEAWHKGYLGLNQDGIMVSVVNDFSVNNVIYSFPYNKINNCDEKTIIQKEENMENCFKFSVQLNGLFSNSLLACPKHKTEYQKLLQVKYFTYEFDKQCHGKINSLIKETYQNFRDPNDIYELYELYSLNVLSEQIYKFLCNEININQSLSDYNKIRVENKIIFLLRHLGKNIHSFLNQKFKIGIFSPSDVMCHKTLKSLLLNSLDKNYKITSNNKEIKLNKYSEQLKTENGYFNAHPESKGKLHSLYDPSVWKICSNHPNFVECLCAAYPFSRICKKNYCVKNNSWECNKSYCKNKRNHKSRECECKFNPNSFNCKCKLNPLLKECFCNKNKNSIYCYKNFCRNDVIRNNHMFCICKRNSKAAICQPQFCLKNIKNPQCKCLVNPKSFGCFCDMFPKSNKCKNRKNQGGYLSHIKKLYKDFSINMNNEVPDEDLDQDGEMNKKKTIKNKKETTKKKQKDDDLFKLDDLEKAKRLKALKKNKKRDGEEDLNDDDDETEKINKLKNSHKNKIGQDEIKRMKALKKNKKSDDEEDDQDENEKKDDLKKKINQKKINNKNNKNPKPDKLKKKEEEDDDSDDIDNLKKEEMKKNFDFLKNKKNNNSSKNNKTINKDDNEKDENDNFDDDEAKQKKKFQKLHSKFRNPSNPNFDLFYKFDKNGNIIPKKGVFDVMNPKHPEFNKYYKLNRVGKIVPKMNPNNPNFNLFYKKDDNGNILPRKFLLKKNKNSDENEDDEKDKDQTNNANNKNVDNPLKKEDAGKGYKFNFNIKSPKTSNFFKKLFGAFMNPNNPYFSNFFKRDKYGNIIPKLSMLKLLDPFNIKFKENFKINSRGRIIPKPDPKSPLFSYFYNIDPKTMNLLPQPHFKKLGLNNKKFDPRYDGRNNAIFSKFNPFGKKEFLEKKNNFPEFLPKNKVLGPGGFYIMPDGTKLGVPFGRKGNDGQWYGMDGKPLSPPLVRLGNDGSLYGPDGKKVGPFAVKGPDGKYYNNQGQLIFPLFGKLGPDGRYYGPDGKPFGPVGRKGDNGKYYDANGNPMAKYAKVDPNGKYAGPYGQLVNGKYVDERGIPIDNKKSEYGLLGFNPYGKNGKFKDFDPKNPDVVGFYNKMYGKFSNPNDSKFPYFFKFDKNGNIIPLNSMLKLLNPYDPMFKRLFKINVKGRIVPNDSPLNPQFRAFYTKDKDGKIVPKKFLDDMNLFTHFNNKIFDGLKFNPFDYGLGKKYISFNAKRYYDEIYGKFKNPNSEKFNDLYKFDEKGKIVPKEDELKKLNSFDPDFNKNYEYNKAGKVIPRANPKSPIFNDYYSLDAKENILPSKSLLALEFIKKFNFNSPELIKYYKVLFSKFMEPKNKNFKKYFKYNEKGKLIPKPSILASFNPLSSVFKNMFKVTPSGKLIPKGNPQSPLFKDFYKKVGGNIIMKDFLKKLDLDSQNFNVKNNFKKIKLSYGRPFNVEDPSIIKCYNKLHSEYMNPKSPFFNQFFELDKSTNKIVPKSAEIKVINPDHEDFLESYEFNRFGRVIPRGSPSNPNFKLFYEVSKNGKIFPNDHLLKNAFDYFTKAFRNFKNTFAAKGNKDDSSNGNNNGSINKSKNDKEKGNLNKNKLQNYFDLLFGKFKRPGDPNFEKFYKFDSNGKIIPKDSMLNILNPNDFQKFNKFFELNKNGVVLPRADTTSPLFKLFYKIDENGNIIPNELLSSLKNNLPSLLKRNNIGKDFNINSKDAIDLYKKLYAKYMNKSNPNFKAFFKVNENGEIVPRLNKLKYLDPENRDFKKYYEFDKNGNIIPRMSVSNPNQRLFFKLDSNGYLIPNDYLLDKLGDKAASLFKKDSEEYKKYLENKEQRMKKKSIHSENQQGINNNTNSIGNNQGINNNSNSIGNNQYGSQNGNGKLGRLNGLLNGDDFKNQGFNNTNGTLRDKNQRPLVSLNGNENDSLNRKLEKDGIRVSYSKDANGNDIISLSAKKSGECSSNPNKDKDIKLPSPFDDRKIIKEGIKPILKDEIEIEDSKTCPKKKEDNLPTIEGECDKNDIYCLCRNHPQYKECVCLAYPKSIICNNNYCQDHKDSYECNPSQCDNNPNCENCYCKNNIDDVKCKCKVNPYDKDCFCLQYPLSHLCNENACKINPNTLFCSCKTNLRNKMCSPRYCYDNPDNVNCKCVVNPLSSECKCLNDPTTCERKQFMEAITEFDMKIRDDCSKNKLFYTINPFLPLNQTQNVTNYVVYNNQTEKLLVDPQIIFNMYYPPCIYNPDSPGKDGKNGKSPCIPFPAPLKPCNNTKTAELEKLGISLGKPCLNKDGGPCIDNKTYIGRKLLRNSNPIIIKRYNKINFYNVKDKFHVDEKLPSNLLMLYNKLLLFNTKSEKKALKLFLR